MLTFNHVEFKYSNQPVFSDLNLQIDKGDFVFLIGKSGVGKTTLMRMVYMDILPEAGYVEVAGFNSDAIRVKELTTLRRKLGIVFQDFQLLDDRNVYDNLAFVLHATGTPKKINKRGTSILLATHNYEIVRKVDAKIIRLENGKAVKVMIKKKDDNQS